MLTIDALQRTVLHPPSKENAPSAKKLVEGGSGVGESSNAAQCSFHKSSGAVTTIHTNKLSFQFSDLFMLLLAAYTQYLL
jgi:hypothetical protein